jgi:hypothetical protein
VEHLPVGGLPEASGKTMRFTGTSVLRVQDGLIEPCTSSVASGVVAPLADAATVPATTTTRRRTAASVIGHSEGRPRSRPSQRCWFGQNSRGPASRS